MEPFRFFGGPEVEESQIGFPVKPRATEGSSAFRKGGERKLWPWTPHLVPERSARVPLKWISASGGPWCYVRIEEFAALISGRIHRLATLYRGAYLSRYQTAVGFSLVLQELRDEHTKV